MSYADKFKLPELREGYEVNPSPPAPPPQHHCCDPETKPWEGFYYSAYGVAVKQGFHGTQDEWLATLKGPEGPPGPQGDTGPEGPEGTLRDLNSGDRVRLWFGTLEEYNALEIIYSDVYYNIKESSV